MADALTHNWKNPSVVRFAQGEDPIGLMLKKASAVALNAIQVGWKGPPFDPFALAELLRINVVPNAEVLDARTVPVGGDRMRIEYNPTRSRARTRYSLAHEIAHTFFPDAAKQIRNRLARHEVSGDEWELEMLCNLGAAELLMPTGSLIDFQTRAVSIQDVLDLRRQFEVSTESILLRLIRITHEPYVLFVASRGDDANARYKVDYSMSSRSVGKGLARGLLLPKQSVINNCTAMGYTAAADEAWPGVGHVHLECVGIASFPDSVYPRVAGLLRKVDGIAKNTGSIQFVTGDATTPLAGGSRILAHIVNDTTPNWGAGFGKVVQKKWPDVQRSFREDWARSCRKRLGDVSFAPADDDLTICHLVCQHGYGPSDNPRLRYSALRDCLEALCEKAVSEKATIHMPRIGTGEAGGSWTLVSALIDEVLCAAGLSVTVYDLPSTRRRTQLQKGLFD